MNLFAQPINTFLDTRRFAVLLCALVFATFIAPLAASAESLTVWFQLAVWSVLVAGLYAASNRRAGFIIAGVLILPAVYAWLGPDLLGEKADGLLRLYSSAACVLFTSVIVGEVLLRQQRVSRETLLGGINVYMLLGFAFMLIHAAIELAESGSYTVAGDPLLERVTGDYDGRAFATILYFSFTTLTTLGYGDIVPQSDAARLLTSAEAVVGQLYIAIFIGRLVGLEVGERASRRRSPPVLPPHPTSSEEAPPRS